jgi:hypothetical protein
MKTKTRQATRPTPAPTRAAPVAVRSAAAELEERRPYVPPARRTLNFGNQWDYAPAPEDFKHIKIAPRQALYIGGKFVAPSTGKYFDSINPATEEKLTEVALAGAADVDAAVKAARRAYDTVWGRMSGRERGKYLYRIARCIQEKARELAVLETLDGGKTIKESRDVDLPLVAAHFFYYAGWADKLAYAFPGRTVRPLGVAGQIIPWNFPLLMAAWKIAPALACGNTVVLKPAETTRSPRCARRDLPGGRPPAGRGQHRHRRGRHRRGAGQASGRRQDRLHRLHRGGQAHRPSVAGTKQEADARARRQGGQHHLRRRGHRPGRRGHHQRHLLQPGPRLLRRLAPARAGGHRADRWCASCAPHADPARRRPAGQEHRHRRHQLQGPAGKIRELRQAGEAEGATVEQPALHPARPKGYWFPPTLLHRRHHEPTASRRRRSSAPC